MMLIEDGIWLPRCRFSWSKEAAAGIRGGSSEQPERNSGKEGVYHSISLFSHESPLQNSTSSRAPGMMVDVPFRESLDSQIIILASVLRGFFKPTRIM